MRFFPTVPEPVRALELTERRLAWGLTDDGVPVVATATGLRFGEATLPWTQVEKATWAPPVLSVREVADVEGTGALHLFHMVEERNLAGIVRTCVTSSVGWSEVRALEAGGAVRLVGRRVPGQDALLWQVVHLEGTDPLDPSVRAQVEQAVSALRASLG